MLRKTLIAAIVAVGVLAGTPAQALTVTHHTSSITSTAHWTCPGRDPVEHFTATFHESVFKRDGVRVREITHISWRGWITNRSTGALIRDDGNWTVIVTYNDTGRRFVRSALTGATWRLTIPGVGIVVHQSGRQAFSHGVETETPFGGIADPSAMCPYV
jgi:hypothetical protein